MDASALTKLAESHEILGVEGSAGVPDQEYGARRGVEYERYLPRVPARSGLQRVMSVLKQLQNTSPPICLGDLCIEAGDRAVILRAILDLVEKGLNLTLCLADDEFVAALTGTRLVMMTSEDRLIASWCHLNVR